MDEFSQNIEDIEYLLKNRSNKKPLALYAGSEHKNKHGSNAESSKLSAKEVLANVSRQVKAMQNADSMGSKRVSNTINKFKKREFVPVNMIPVSNEVPLKLKLPTKFETQCVSDTQLINVIENAEIIDTHRGVTQEFDKTFCQKSDNDSDDKSDDGSLKSKTIESTDKCERDVTVSKDKIDNNNELCEIDTQDSQMFKDSDLTCAMDTITCCEDDVPIDVNDDVNLNNSQETQGFNECVEIFDTEIETERSSSPVLNTFKRNATPPLVVDLYTFEKFEDLAVPIIEEHGDLKLAKNMINSQILGREICIPNHFNEKIGRDSPVLSKIECITTNINKEEVEKICSCSNKCVDDEDVNLGTSNKKTESENKTELKDEILFSSDEEYEYLHKNVQELPLTCALETSFYDRSDVLDKTMYVGFQTASNKSIQINTDSFTKAKSILSDIGNEETGKSLSELVEIFDTGKIVSTDEETTNHTPNTVVEDENKEKATPFTITTDLKKSRDDTSVLFLTSLEEEEVKDDIVMSQIIPCKSLSRCSQINNSVIPDRKTSASVNSTALELNKDIDDDTIMSQVIQFKSIPRTPNVHNISTTNVSHETLHLNAGITKRKFEGFKTASNKKIKLSDKALARCNKVFQDIDLGDPDPYVSCDSNIVETEEKEDNFLDDLKSQDFNVSYDDDIKTISEKDHVVSATKMNPEVHDSDSKSELRIKEDQSEVNDVDLQINDNILLQEFEDNEMPLENNNNSFLGLKTASNRNIGVFADSVAPTANDCNNAIKNARNISEDKNEHIFKKPADISKSATSQTKSPVEILKIINNNDQERSNSEKHLSNEFIGFKTASHKEIIVSKQAMEKTKAIFKDIDEEVVNHTENDTLNTEKKQINNLTDDFNCGIDTQDFLAEELTHIEELFKDNIIEKQKSTSPIFQGFQTANKKPIVISEKALEKSKKLLEDITNKELDVKCNTIGNNSDTTSTNYANKNQIPVFTGFHTASNKKVVVSKKGIEASKTFFQDIVLSQQENEGHSEGVTEVPRNKIENLTSKVPVSDIEVIAITEITSQNRTNTGGSTSTDAEPPFVGFRTASAKPINISANALKTTKKLLNEFHLDGDIMFKEICDQRDEPSGFIGFQTASNKKITISDKALAKSKQMLNEFQLKDDIKNDNSDHIKNIQDNSSENTSKNHGVNDRAEDSNTNISSKFIGFQTASNKKVNISKEALAKSKQMFQNIGDKECDVEKYSRSDENTSRTGLGFKTASNKTVNISEKDLEISKRIFDDTNDLTKTDKGTPVFKGFQTASNKMVKISEKALAKSKKMFEDLNLSQLNKDPTSVLDKPVNNVDSSQISNNRTEVSEQSVAITKRIIKNVNHEEKNLAKNAITGFKGFQTASNKKVQISEEALSKSKRLFEDINLSQVGKDANITENVPKNNFVGFQTHNNKMVEVSEKALPTTKIIFKSQVEKSNDDIKEDTPIFKGFQTASNKKVEVSEKALAKSKRLFEDMNLSQLDKDTKTTDIHENKFVGFQTANNRVKASEQAIAKTKDMFKDVLETEEENVTKDTAPVFKGFQTANHKKVEISEAALARSKRLFEDLNLSQLDKDSRSTRENNFGGFQTANDKKVTVSAQALAKTKEVFEDIKEKENYDKGANETVKREVTSFKGFQTASNKKVVISENALSKCKQLFDDFNLSQLNNNSRPIIDSSESLTAKVNEENEVKNKQINNFGNSPRSSTSNKKVKISDEASHTNIKKIWKPNSFLS
ncbi:breast cancer type 2 susceptibility protein homolog [Leguminivora glycinivorella]|uniref:breast cancer type 2 susceptibility protein homolog n=1 Tax=Leguminivora glycinivorella TaxID=1035111 RepID=UPI00200FB3D4|nr:breast cancer type 2 susceptibility protein homolog [Leguminivora glycinivorella]